MTKFFVRLDVNKSVGWHIDAMQKHLERHKGSVVVTPHASFSVATPWGTFAMAMAGELNERTGQKAKVVVYNGGKLSDNRYEPGRLPIPFSNKKVKVLSIRSKLWDKCLVQDVPLSALKSVETLRKELENFNMGENVKKLLEDVIKTNIPILQRASSFPTGLSDIVKFHISKFYPNIEVISSYDLIRDNVDFFAAFVLKVISSKHYDMFLNRVGSLGRKYRDLLNVDLDYDILKYESKFYEDMRSGKVYPSVIPFMAFLIEREGATLHIGGEHMIHYVEPLITLLSQLNVDVDGWKYFHVGRATMAGFFKQRPSRGVDFTKWVWDKEDKHICHNSMFLPLYSMLDLRKTFKSVERLVYKEVFASVPILVDVQ